MIRLQTVSNGGQFVGADPLMTAIHFQRRFRSLLKHVINGPLTLLGEALDYFARVEFQTRGSPHIDAFFWCKDVPRVGNAHTHKELLSYVNKVISTQLPDEKKMHSYLLLLRHYKHTDTQIIAYATSMVADFLLKLVSKPAYSLKI